MITLNGNVMCAIDVETTGTIAGYHEITQVCFLPLDKDLEVRRDIVPLDMLLHIEFEDRINWDSLRISKTDFMRHQQVSIDKYVAFDLFNDWVTKLNLPPNKRISPLAHNWSFDRGFIFDWLQPTAFGTLIDGRYRDTMAMAASINDIYDILNEPIPFPKINLSYLAATLKIEHPRAHNALDDCITTVKVYKALLNRGYLDGTNV